MANFFPLLSEGKELQQLYAQSGGIQTPTAQSLNTGDTIATSGPPLVDIARVSPAAAVTGIILQPGVTPGQNVWVVNEAAIGNSVQFATAATSNIADGANCILLGGRAKLFVWDSAANSGAGFWYEMTNTVGGALTSIVSATSPDPGANGTINTVGVGVALVTPAAARTGIILQPGSYNGQEIWVVNQGAAANTLTFNTTPATANVADSATESAIAGLKARKFVWIGGSTNLWYPASF
jgi:hypothetical protein